MDNFPEEDVDTVLGNGKTAGKGHKGQKARSEVQDLGFEGNRCHYIEEYSKRGFTNRNTKTIVGTWS